MQVAVLMAPAACGRCSSRRRIHNMVTGWNAVVSLSEWLQCHTTGTAPVTWDACMSQQSPELPSAHRCGAVLHKHGQSPTGMPGTTRCQQKKVHGHRSHPENRSRASQHPPTAQSCRESLHTPRIHTDCSAEHDLLVWIKSLEEIKTFPLQTRKKSGIWKKSFEWTECSHWCHW